MFTTDRRLRRWWPMLAAVPLGALCGGGYALAASPSYVANAYVMAVPKGGSDSTTAVNFAQAYGRIISQPEILLGPAARTGVSLDELTSRVEAVTSPDAPMIQIAGTAGRARLAAREANAVAESLVDFGNATTSQTGVQLLRFASAATPAGPSTPSRGIDLAVGLAAGLLLGGLGMMARQSCSTAAELSDSEVTAADRGAAEATVADLPQPRPLAEGESVPAPAPADEGTPAGAEAAAAEPDTAEVAAKAEAAKAGAAKSEAAEEPERRSAKARR